MTPSVHMNPDMSPAWARPTQTIKREQGFDVGRHVFAAQSHVETALAVATGVRATSCDGRERGE